MSVRLRFVLIAVVVMAALAVSLVAVTSPGAMTTPDGTIEALAPARIHRPAISTPELRDLRALAVVPTGALPPITIFLVLAGIVGRYLRRIGDVGDDWRSLLEGAPPALR